MDAHLWPVALISALLLLAPVPLNADQPPAGPPVATGDEADLVGLEALLAADGKRRYEYFVHRVCDMDKIWGLHHNGWASLGDGDTIIRTKPRDDRQQPSKSCASRLVDASIHRSTPAKRDSLSTTAALSSIGSNTSTVSAYWTSSAAKVSTSPYETTAMSPSTSVARLSNEIAAPASI